MWYKGLYKPVYEHRARILWIVNLYVLVLIQIDGLLCAVVDVLVLVVISHGATVLLDSYTIVNLVVQITLH